MKVKEVYIKDFRQFKNFKLDLTYPKGHAKEGQPLDKVCFIGQSGTGKTSLLNMLFAVNRPTYIAASINTMEIVNNVLIRTASDEISEHEFTLYFIERLMDVVDGVRESENAITSKAKISQKKLEDEIESNTGLSSLDKIREKVDGIKLQNIRNKKILFFPAELNYKLKKENSNSFKADKKTYDFSQDNIFDIWNLLLEDITKHQEEELKIRQQISVVAETGNIKAIQEEVKKLEEWKTQNFNPVKDVADNCIDKLIAHFSLRVKQDLDIQQKDDIGFIKIEDLNGNEVPNAFWSTGTKQVVLSALPLYLLKPESSIIFFDEPERSLYPDLQRIIIDYYQSLTNDSQFFYATHSPIIASSFEPWEIVELKFNDSGHVYRELYFEGENHVDNYYIDPRFLNFDLMLKEVFDMKYTNGDMRYEALSKYGMLKNQLDTLKKADKLQTPEAKNIYKEFKSLSKKLAVNPE